MLAGRSTSDPVVRLKMYMRHEMQMGPIALSPSSGIYWTVDMEKEEKEKEEVGAATQGETIAKDSTKIQSTNSTATNK